MSVYSYSHCSLLLWFGHVPESLPWRLNFVRTARQPFFRHSKQVSKTFQLIFFLLCLAQVAFSEVHDRRSYHETLRSCLRFFSKTLFLILLVSAFNNTQNSGVEEAIFFTIWTVFRNFLLADKVSISGSCIQIRPSSVTLEFNCSVNSLQYQFHCFAEINCDFNYIK